MPNRKRFRNLSPALVAAALLVGACNDNDDHRDGGVANRDGSVANRDGGAAADGSATVGDGGGTLVSQGLAPRVLVGDQTGAPFVDPKLVNAWGLAFGPTGIAWVAANGSGVVELYAADGTPNATLPSVTVPAPAGATSASAPTGIARNDTATALMGDQFVIATEDGTIAGWQPSNGAAAVMRVDRSAGADHAVYKGIAVATATAGVRVYAADFHNARIDVFDAHYAPVSASGAFVDPNLPAGFAPFNVAQVNGRIFVSYAKQDTARKDHVPGVGNGFIDTFDLDGGAMRRLISGGQLNSPWGMTIAPSGLGNVSGQLLVGNFGDGHVSGYDPSTGSLRTSITGSGGNPFTIDGLWALVVGPANALYFTAGPAEEKHGVFGRIDVMP